MVIWNIFLIHLIVFFTHWPTFRSVLPYVTYDNPSIARRIMWSLFKCKELHSSFFILPSTSHQLQISIYFCTYEIYHTIIKILLTPTREFSRTSPSLPSPPSSSPRLWRQCPRYPYTITLQEYPLSHYDWPTFQFPFWTLYWNKYTVHFYVNDSNFSVQFF